MSDLGLSNLAKLKARLLPADFTSGTTYDTLITQLGKGVAGLMEKYCNRLWKYTAGETDEFHAERTHWILQRYPVNTITSIEQRDSITGGWTTLTTNDVILQRDDKAGLIKFGAIQGTHLSQMRVTYSGGYWYDTTEDGTGTLPAGATALRDDILEAYFLQCAAEWNVLDKQGGNVATQGGSAPLLGLSLPGLELIPKVKQMLAAHRRMAVT